MATVEETSALLRARRALFVAGDESLLRRLPRGTWVGGTSAYFIAEEGGVQTRDRLCVSLVPDVATETAIHVYGPGTIERVYRDVPDNGFGLVVVPAESATLRAFALNAPRFENFACRPLIGWVAGVELPDLGKVAPRVFDGSSGQVLNDAAVVLHVSLPRTLSAEVGIVNIFERGEGDDLTFAEDGFAAREVLVAGKPTPFVRYLQERAVDTRLPLVADYNGAMVNISFQRVDVEAGEVRFYAPVFRGVHYRLARPVGDYVTAFSSQLPEDLPRVAWSCNCVLNYIHAGLEGRRTPGFTGPATFGEIAYQLVNQTLVYLRIGEANLAERLRGETELRRQLRALEAATRELDAFNAMVSHDLRSPLRRMRTYAELLLTSPTVAADPATRDSAARVVASAETMSLLLDDLLRFSRVGREELTLGPVDLGELVAEAREELRGEWTGREFTWDVHALPVVLGDRTLLRQVFVNLLSNALKYTRDRPLARVEVHARREGADVVIAVRDNGIGFDAGASERLFRPFSRLASAHGLPGTGMGLAIVERIVSRHGGKVRAEGTPGVGACFSVWLPGA